MLEGVMLPWFLLACISLLFVAIDVRDDFPDVVHARDGGSSSRSLTSTFIPELLSMNLLMAGMVADGDGVEDANRDWGQSDDPAFWFVMSLGLLVGFVIAYPMNWWLVANHLKHGMMTVRPAGMSDTMQDHGADAGARRAPHLAHETAMEAKSRPRPPVPVMALLSFAALVAGFGESPPRSGRGDQRLSDWPDRRCYAGREDGLEIASCGATEAISTAGRSPLQEQDWRHRAMVPSSVDIAGHCLVPSRQTGARPRVHGTHGHRAVIIS
jgi:hypothetical protein